MKREESCPSESDTAGGCGKTRAARFSHNSSMQSPVRTLKYWEMKPITKNMRVDNPKHIPCHASTNRISQNKYVSASLVPFVALLYVAENQIHDAGIDTDAHNGASNLCICMFLQLHSPRRDNETRKYGSCVDTCTDVHNDASHLCRSTRNITETDEHGNKRSPPLFSTRNDATSP